MRESIHPKYNTVTVTCTTCGAEFETGSVLDSIKVDTCSNCHPFYTGKQNAIQADGRVDRFNKRFETAQKVKAEHDQIVTERAKRAAERAALEEENN
ncbi:50S ribosomal protein L31 [Mycoplasmatota bacterium]|nr:50S ribosomal protein L31 [Mycoplasmatota bacterium]